MEEIIQKHSTAPVFYLKENDSTALPEESGDYHVQEGTLLQFVNY